ncbi:MAG TPA: hypothetical protein VMY42_21285 [Thermoguttaceae bacterium]|nr:hypothetical protein [Thermoguttaceae bacterium]
MNCGRCQHFCHRGGGYGRCTVFSLDGYDDRHFPRTHKDATCPLTGFRRREGRHPGRRGFSSTELVEATERLETELRQIARRRRRAVALTSLGLTGATPQDAREGPRTHADGGT